MHRHGTRRCGPVLEVHVLDAGGDTNGSYISTLTIRILPVGTGKLCVVPTIGVRGVPVAVPYKPGTRGTLIKPERACP
jgi:hypothetical protein